MNITNEDVKVLGRVVSISTENTVASAEQVYDEYYKETGEFQHIINKRFDEIAGDKPYDPDEEGGGMGRVTIEKNIEGDRNILVQEMMPYENTIYIIQYDFDLDHRSITVPENSILYFSGGSFSEGSLTGEHYHIIGNRDIFRNVQVSNINNDIISADWFRGTDEEKLMYAKTASNTGTLVIDRSNGELDVKHEDDWRVLAYATDTVYNLPEHPTNEDIVVAFNALTSGLNTGHAIFKNPSNWPGVSSYKPYGTSAERPTQPVMGFYYFDTTLDRPIWWNGTDWVYYDPITNPEIDQITGV